MITDDLRSKAKSSKNKQMIRPGSPNYYCRRLQNKINVYNLQIITYLKLI